MKRVRSGLTYIAVSVGLIWAIFVVYRYLSVDDNLLFKLIHVYESYLPLCILFCGLLLFACVLLGYASGQNRHRKILIGIISLIAIGATSLIMHSTIQSIWLKVNNLVDGEKASLILIIATLVGVGIGLGARIKSSPSVTLGFLTICLLFPFLFTVFLSGAITSVLALVWLFLIAYALGMIVLNWINCFIKISSTSINHAGLLSIAVGLGILVLVTLGLGLVGCISTKSILIGLLLLTAVCFPQIKSKLMFIADLPWRKPLLISEFEIGGLFSLAALFLIYFICALAPEVGADALGFRIAAPTIWLRDGIIMPLPEMLNSYGSFAGELIYLLVMPLTGFNAAKVVQFGLSILLVVSAYTQVPGLRHRKETPFFLFAFWGSTLVWWQMAWGFVDLTQMFFYYACILALRFWLDEPESPIWLIGAGITGATATMIKLNGAGALVIAGLVVICITLYQMRSLAKVTKNLLCLGIPTLFCLLPWLIRSYLLTKNPIFPYANQIFKSPLILDVPVVHFGVGLSFPDVLSVPWGIFFNPAQYVELGTYHPLILACAVLGAIGLIWFSSRKDWLWLGAGMLAFISWLVTEQNLRYSLFAIYFLALAFGIGILKLQDRFSGRIKRKLFQFLLLIGLIWGFGMQAVRPSFILGSARSGHALPTNVVFGEQTDFDYLTNNVPTYFCAQKLNQHYGQNAKIFQVPPIRDHLYFDALVYSLPHGILSVTQPLNEILSDSDNATIYQHLIDAGYTHLVYDTALMTSSNNTLESEQEGIFSTEFEDTYLQLECADRGLRLYKIRSTSKPAITPILNQQDLLKNSNFETLNAAGLPVDWSLSGKETVIKSGDNKVLRLDDEATITQAVIVSTDVTYELIAEYRAVVPEHTASIQINWYDSTGKLRLFWRETVNPTDSFISYSFLQTVPPGVQTAVVYVSGSGVEVDNIILRKINTP